MTCTRCGSYAINPHHHGRKEGEKLHLCDVCYWRGIAEERDEDAKVFTLECSLCRKREDVYLPGIEPAGLKDLLGRIGWVKGASRSDDHATIFCSRACYEASCKKSGGYKKAVRVQSLADIMATARYKHHPLGGLE